MRSILSCLSAVILSTILVSSFSACSKLKGGSSSENGLSENDLNAQREKRFGEGSIPTAEGEGMFHDVSFGYDSAVVNDDARSDVEFNANVLREHSDLKVQLEGHCDERGTADYNLTLGLQRAKAVEQVLLSLGIPKSRVETISYGEEVPLDTGHTEFSWAKNRRVHFSPYDASGARR